MATYRADRRSDLERLADDMRALPISKKLVGLVACWHHGLMLPRGWLRVVMFFLRSPARRFLMVHELHKREPAAVADMWDQTILHMLTGHDREEASSVGGFSQREMDILVDALGLSGPSTTEEAAA